MDLRVFFSWQSDTDSKNLHHTSFIRTCIQQAIAQVNKELPYVHIIYQDGMKGASGNREVVPTLEERIDNCHIFIGDLTFINKENVITRIIKKFLGIKYKITPNPNAIYEASRFTARPFMERQGFFVQNTVFGDPNKDVRLMFFDQRGKRFPISFFLREYNEGTPKEKYAKEQKEFISVLTGAIRECAEQAVFHLEEDIKPFHNWEGHKTISGFEGGYINKGLDTYLKQIRENKSNLRISGLSGLGKTRMVLEAFKDKSVQFLYAYIDCQEHNQGRILEKTAFMFEHYKEMVLVFDNCGMELHDKIVRMKHSNHAVNPIITIYNDPDENSTPYSTPLRLQKDFNEVVEKIIERFSKFYKPEDKEKLIAFAGGIPMMAQLLVDGLRHGDPLGVVNDSVLMNKILDTDESSTDRKIIRSISLFDNIGFEDNLHKELEFVARTKEITSIDMDEHVLEQEFDRVVYKYLQRKIIERKGRLVRVRPTPIALYLIGEWIEQCSDSRLLAVINAIQASEVATSLTNSFADQFRYMGHNVKARNMLNQLLGINSPFGNAEVINTDLGSRLFRSFVEVNPGAVANCLRGVIGSLPIDKLKAIDEGRRNLVWTIEKLCFEPTTFEKGAELMLLLGLAENEEISNNATGQFSALFPVFLPATAASLEQRLYFLNTQMQYTDRRALLMNALDRALRTRDFIYFSGAEQRGTEQLSNYQPKTRKEIFDYINGCLELLMSIVDEDKSLLDRCCEILEKNLGCLCEAGYGTQVMSCVHKVADKKHNEWEKMLDSLRFIINHNGIPLTNELRADMEKMIRALSNDDFFFRFSQVEKKNRWTSDKFSYEETMRRNNDEYEKLAKEMAADSQLYSVEILKKIYTFDGYFGSTFGKVVAKSLNEEGQKIFIENSIHAFKSLEKYTFSIFIDFISNVEEQEYGFTFEEMKQLNQKAVLFASVAARKYPFDSFYPDELYKLAKEGKAAVEDYEQLWRFMPFRSHSEDDVIHLFKRILSLPDSFRTVIHMSMMLFWGGMKDNTSRVREFIAEEILRRSAEFSELAKEDDYWHIMRSILDSPSKTEFAKTVMHNLLLFISNTSDLYYRNYNIENCMEVLVNNYFDEVWPELSDALVSNGEKFMLYYHLKSILGSITGFNDEVGILFKSDHTEALLNWCAKYPMIAPERLMQMSPLYEENKFSKIVIQLLNIYGEQESVLSALSCNMGSYSFVGSVVPLFERQLQCVEQLSNHPIENVRQWVVKMISYLKQQIAEEKNRDAEGYR